MKILYAIQGTGNGHITRGMEIIPLLKKKGTVDVLLSGTQCDLKLPVEVKYRFQGLCFVFGKKGGVDILQTYLKINSLRFLREIRNFDVKEYDLVISDFEPVSSWACILAKKPSVGLSNQVALLHPESPKPKKKDLVGTMILEHYAPTSFNYGYHFRSFDQNIFTPVLRRYVRNIEVNDKRHYTVYLPSYDDEKVIKHLTHFKDIEWQVFSKHNRKKTINKNVSIQPVELFPFLRSMANCSGVLCNAGFGTASEALFLQKKLMVIPMKTQYEQQCNAVMLRSMGVAVIKKLKSKHYTKMEEWLNSGKRVNVSYPDITESILDTIIANHAGRKSDVIDTKSPYALFQ